ncbi:MAG TPA: tetratricopeptide repeat protein [Candidatus Polarisedimenticolia bacterium]|nr:tetratricopeptide repeat protein [Candidatus Polarisedimenticolia bacterium]
MRRSLSLLALLTCSFMAGACAASEAKRAAAEGSRLYDRGEYDAARPLLEKAVAKGMKDGRIWYQLAYIYDQKGDAAKAADFRQKAEPLLSQRVSSAGGTVEDAYCLTALYNSQQRLEEVRKTAQAGLKKFAARRDLDGEDWFRLGRLHQFAGNGELAAGAYRKASEKMEMEKDASPVLFALALVSDAGTDLQSRRFDDAARKLEKAESINPKSPPAAYDVALAELGARRYAKARESFARVRDEATVSEAQYGVDVARHLEACGGALDKNLEGKPLLEMDNPSLEAALASAATSFREAKAKAGDGSDATREKERHFFSLAAEWMIRGNSLRETSLGGNYADLIRR